MLMLFLCGYIEYQKTIVDNLSTETVSSECKDRCMSDRKIGETDRDYPQTNRPYYYYLFNIYGKNKYIIV